MIHIYGLIVGIAVVVGWSVAEKIDPKVNRVAPWVIGLGLIGARIWHVVDLWEYYSQNLDQIVAVWKGGLSIWGGIIGGGVGVLICHYTIKALDHLGEMMGAIVTALPLAQAIGRLGNAVNGEFINKVWILPWWAAEAVADFLLFCLIWRIRRIWPIGVIWIYLVGYGLIRLVLQPYRL